MTTITNERYEVRLHHANNDEDVLFKSSDVIAATSHAKDCRAFDPKGSLLVYDMHDKRIVESF